MSGPDAGRDRVDGEDLAGEGIARAGRGHDGLARDALLTVGTRLGLAVLILGTDVVLARLLGPDAKGRFTLILLLSQLAAVLAGWGMDAALGVVAGRSRDDARRGFANAVLWTGVVGGFAVVVSCWLYGLPTDTRPAGPLVALIPNLSGAQFLFAALAIPGELGFAIALYALLGRRRVSAYNLIRLLRRATLLVLIVGAAAVARLSLDVAVVCNLIALGLTAAAIFAAAQRDGIASFRPSGSLLVEELRFGTQVLPGTIAERLQLRSDAFLLNLLVSVRATGVYSVTSGLAETLWYVPNALGTIMFSRAVDPGEDAATTAVLLARATVAITLILAIPAFVLGPWLVETVYGAGFAEAGVALRWILPGIVAYSVVAVLSRYLTGLGRPGLATAIMLAGLAINLVANAVLIPSAGISGAAASSSISYGVTAVLTMAAFRRVSGRGLVETLVLRPHDVTAGLRSLRRGRGSAEDEGAEPGPGEEP